MKIFIIGATGYIGRVVAQTLYAAGHTISGLARTEYARAELVAAGITPYWGDLNKPSSLLEGALAADGLIYLAAAPSFAVDRQAVEALLSAYRGSGKVFIFTSGSAVVADAAAGEHSERVYTETMPAQPSSAMLERVEIENRVLQSAQQAGIHSVVLRPPLVYGRGGSIQVPLLIDLARQTGTACYIGVGENIWSTVHVDDLAALYQLVLAHSGAGELYHTASGEVQMRDLANAVGRLLGLGPAVSWPVKEAQSRGSFVAGLGSNSRISGDKARTVLGWNPQQPSVLYEVEHGSYVTR